MSQEKNERRNDREALEYLDKILKIVLEIKRMGDKMADDFQTLMDDAALQSTQLASVKVLVAGLVANQANPAKLQALVKAFAGNEQQILDVITLGTPAAVITVTPSPVSVAVGATQQLTVKDMTGADVTATATYTSADATKATVSVAGGLVTGVAVGSTTISVASAQSAATVQVTVA